jgi:hypothetical protein
MITDARSATADSTPHDEIADLEARIEDLAERAGRCGRMMHVIKAAVLAGALLLAFMVVGVIRFSPVLFVGGIAVLLGGTALFGSTRSTRDELVADIARCEAQRTAMIDALALRHVEPG